MIWREHIHKVVLRLPVRGRIGILKYWFSRRGEYRSRKPLEAKERTNMNMPTNLVASAGGSDIGVNFLPI